MTSYRELIAAKIVKRADGMKVRFEDIHERDGFNLRDKDEEFLAKVTQLADFICAGGKIPPLEVIPRADGDGVDVVDGHRRRMAIGIAIQRGSECVIDKDGETWVRVEAFDGDAKAQDLRILSSDSGEKLKPIERAMGYKRLRDQRGMSVEEIASADFKSEQFVSMLLTLADADPIVHALVREDRIAAMEAAKQVRAANAAGKDVIDHFRALMDKAAADGAGKVTASTANGKALPKKLAHAAIDAGETFLRALPREVQIRLTEVEMHPENMRPKTIEVPVTELLALVAAHTDIQEVRERQASRARDKAQSAKQGELSS